MTNQYVFAGDSNRLTSRLAYVSSGLSRRALIAVVLMISLFAFELFNFDTTRFALNNLMGEIRFLGFEWAAILAIAFCSIDFAGLVRLFTPEKGRDEPREVWYLMGAWLLGATMNALMTWWAVSLTLLNHEFGNEVMSREKLLEIVPVFVAVLVWLTRILFIGAFTVAGEHLFDFQSASRVRPGSLRRKQSSSDEHDGHEMRKAPRPVQTRSAGGDKPFSEGRRTAQIVRDPVSPAASEPVIPNRIVRQGNSRIKQRPPMPNGIRRAQINGVQARSRASN